MTRPSLGVVRTAGWWARAATILSAMALAACSCATPIRLAAHSVPTRACTGAMTSSRTVSASVPSSRAAKTTEAAACSSRSVTAAHNRS